MTEQEKPCGLVSFLPMSCRGRAEAFARRLHIRLRSLNSQDGDSDNPGSSENGWLMTNEMPTSVTNLQPRNDNELVMDFGMFDSPASPEEEISESDFNKFITNSKDDLSRIKFDDVEVISPKTNCPNLKRNSLDSDSSDYYDPENLDTTNNVSNSYVNGINHKEEASPSNSLASLDNTSEECFEETSSIDQVDSEKSSNWFLPYEPNKSSNKNNNVYNAINLDLLNYSKSDNKEILENGDGENSENGLKKESYCSHLDIQQNLTVDCPDSVVDSINPLLEISTLEIQDTDEVTNSGEIKDCVANDEVDANHLNVSSIISENEIDLEEPQIPRVRRCSSLKTGKTPPGTPGRKKIVRFADVLGLDLADVRTFMDEIPKIPNSAYNDLSGVDLTFSDNSSSSSSSLDMFHKSNKTLVPLFQQPGGQLDFMDRVRTNQVCLENAIQKDFFTLCVCGTVRVRNLDFHKSVHIRYTIDAWKSFSDLQATYVDNSCDGFSDKFSFTLYVHTLNIGQRLEFAVRFQCKGFQFWDNNNDQNYCFQCLPSCSSTSYVPITVPDEHNWAGAAFY